jgi:hypothetical protein
VTFFLFLFIDIVELQHGASGVQQPTLQQIISDDIFFPFILSFVRLFQMEFVSDK